MFRGRGGRMRARQVVRAVRGRRGDREGRQRGQRRQRVGVGVTAFTGAVGLRGRRGGRGGTWFGGGVHVAHGHGVRATGALIWSTDRRGRRRATLKTQWWRRSTANEWAMANAPCMSAFDGRRFFRERRFHGALLCGWLLPSPSFIPLPINRP